MKDHLVQYAAYNAWANQRIFEMIGSMDAEKHLHPVKSSFVSLHDTLLHMWNAESAWWQRLKLQERIIFPSEIFKGTVPEMMQQMLQQSQLYSDWVSNASDAALVHVFQYYDSKKEHFKQPVWQVLMHVFNHSNYHRGQLVTMMRQLGEEKIPSTDFIMFTRKK